MARIIQMWGLRASVRACQPTAPERSAGAATHQPVDVRDAQGPLLRAVTPADAVTGQP